MISKFYAHWNVMRAAVVILASVILMTMFIQGHCWEDTNCPIDPEPDECYIEEEGEPHFCMEPSAPHERE